VSPSVSSLKKVLDGVPMPLAEFFTMDLSVAPQAFFGADELVELGNPEVRCAWWPRSAPGASSQCCMSATPPAPPPARRLLAHRGEEAGVVIRGRIELTVGGATRVLGPGEAYYFATSSRIASATSGASRVRSSAPARRRRFEPEGPSS